MKRLVFAPFRWLGRRWAAADAHWASMLNQEEGDDA